MVSPKIVVLLLVRHLQKSLQIKFFSANVRTVQERSNDTSNDQQKKSQRVSCVISKALVSSTIGEYDGPDYSARHPLQILPAVTTWKAPGRLTVN